MFEVLLTMMCVANGINRICWDAFVDKESPITSYSYQVYKQIGEKPGAAQDVAITPAVKVSLTTMEVVVENLQLKVCFFFTYIMLHLIHCVKTAKTTHPSRGGSIHQWSPSAIHNGF